MNKFIKLFLIFTSLLLIFISCSNGTNSPITLPADNPTTDNPTTDNPTIKSQSVSKKLKLNITDATNLYIGKSNSTSSRSARAASNDTEKKLFKITEDGFVQEITYTYEITTVTEYEVPYEEEVYDEEGNVTGTVTKTKIETKTEVTTETTTDIQVPSSLVSLDSKYLIVCFDSDNYLVNKENGYCYKYTNDLPTNFETNSYHGENLVSDKEGNIYFLSNNSVKKLNISNIEEITISNISARTDNVSFFGVDNDGNVAYGGTDGADNHVLRFKINGGSFETLPGPGGWGFTTFWTGFDGYIYYYNPMNLGYGDYTPVGSTSRIKKLIAKPEYSWEDYTHDATIDPGNQRIKNMLCISNPKRIIMVSGDALFEVYNEETKTVRKIPYNTFNLTNSKVAKASSNYYYIAGVSTSTKTVLVRINPVDDSFTTLLNGTYDIYKMEIDSDDKVTFNALSLIDGSIVIGTVDANGNTEILENNLEEEVVVLERLK